MGGGSFFDLWVVPVMLEVRATVARGCGRSLLSDQTPAICGCSPVARRPLRIVPHFASCLPEQQRSNNSSGCFNWFHPMHSRRNQGEPLSIRQMIEKCVVDFGIDRRQVFVTGLSAGGGEGALRVCLPPL